MVRQARHLIALPKFSDTLTLSQSGGGGTDSVHPILGATQSFESHSPACKQGQRYHGFPIIWPMRLTIALTMVKFQVQPKLLRISSCCNYISYCILLNLMKFLPRCASYLTNVHALSAYSRFAPPFSTGPSLLMDATCGNRNGSTFSSFSEQVCRLWI